MGPRLGWRRLFELGARPFRGSDAVEAEIATHLELQARDLVARGWTRPDAEREAARRFGDVGSYRDRLVTMSRRGGRRRQRREWGADLIADLRQVVRGLASSRTFLLGVSITLALGIGVNSAMIGLVDRLLFKAPAEVRDPDRVARYSLTQTNSFGTFRNSSVTWPEFELARDGLRSTESVAAFFTSSISLGRGDAAKPLRITIATPSLFSLLGVAPSLGRFFGPAEDAPGGGEPVVVLSDRLWDRDYGRDPAVLGRRIWLGSREYAVIGVAPRYFVGVDLDAVDAWVPFRAGQRELMGFAGDDSFYRTWDWQATKVLVRLRPGVSRAAASAEATTLYRHAVAQVADRRNEKGVVTFLPVIAGRGADESREPLIAALLAGVSILVLLVTCANVANLMLARGLARRREVAVRLALGVGRRRLIRMFLLESIGLAGFGAIGGVAIAYGGGVLIRRWLLPGIEFVEPPVDGRLLGLTVVVALLTAVLIGLVPALRLTRPDLAAELKAGGSGNASAGRPQARLRTGLLFAQGALSAMLLAGAGLFLESFVRVNRVDFGFRPTGLILAAVDLGPLGLDPDRQIAFYDRAYERFKSVPGIGRVSLSSAIPFATRMTARLRVPGRDSIPRLASGGPYFAVVSPEYFETMEIPIRKGRPFGDQDRDGAPTVMAINETMARTIWPGEEPIGRCVFIGDDTTHCRTVVAVVGDASSESLDLAPTQAYYLPLAQQGHGANARSAGARDRILLLRTAADPAATIATVRRELLGLEPNLPYSTVRLLQDQIDPLLQPWRLGAMLFGAMAAIALLIAMVGLYSSLSYSVAQRRREFGIRTALGAGSGQVASLIVLEGQRVLVGSVLVGLGIVVAAGGLLRPFLFNTSPRDPAVLIGVAAALLGTALLGSLLPAHRASRAEPMSALRQD